MIKSILYKIYKTLNFYGFDPEKLLKAIKFKPVDWFYADLEEIQRQQEKDRTFQFYPMFPILTGKNEPGGVMTGHYLLRE